MPLVSIIISLLYRKCTNTVLQNANGYTYTHTLRINTGTARRRYSVQRLTVIWKTLFSTRMAAVQFVLKQC